MTGAAAFDEVRVRALLQYPDDVREAYRRLEAGAALDVRRGGLTPQQLRVFRFIERHVAAHGTSPSFLEMRDALDLRTKSSVHRLVEALEERGFIRRQSRRARSIEIVARAA
ncbi:LexA family protein [Aureimonas leprariae]|uniref:Helix-turn-helix domain-containing protein n=1 Tax=Plantimonas leprariae TaxID=2615207 RepID=A0A7V7PRD2_9HYPH|nr:helix-turn-helix domain-containing protein [Aureimonas leprariae]